MNVFNHHRIRWQQLGRHCLTVILLAFAVAPALSAHAESADDYVDEYRLKAAFIYNFTQFIDWPTTAFEQANSPFAVCVMGSNPFGNTLLALQKRSYKSHPIVISYPKTLAEARRCHILYLDDPSTNLLGNDVKKSLGDAPILTISSSPDAAESDIGIGFVRQNEKMRWTLNLDTVHRARLKVSAKLIEIAVTVIGEAGRKP